MNDAGRGTRIRAILFDKDGTLLDFRSTWLPVYRGAAAELAALAGGGPVLARVLLRRYGYDLDRDRFTAESPLLWASTAQLAALWAAEPELAAVPDVHARMERHFADHDAYPPVAVAGLAPLFDRLRTRGLKLGLATMDGTDALERTLARFDLKAQIDFRRGCGRRLRAQAGAGHGPGLL